MQTVGRRYDHATVFCCLPLRTAVVLTGLGCAVLGLAMVTSRATIQEDLRPFVGGYAASSRTLVGFLETLGLGFGLIGAAGAVQMKASWLQLYLTYQVVRLFVWLPVFFFDVPLLWNCELWMSSLKSATQRYGWNDVIFNVALNNGCQQERSAFTMLAFPSFLFFLYCTSVTQQLLLEIEKEPRHLLQGVVSGAFYTRSLASRSVAKQIEDEQVQRSKEEAQSFRAFGSIDAFPAGGWGSMQSQTLPHFDASGGAMTYRPVEGSMPVGNNSMKWLSGPTDGLPTGNALPQMGSATATHAANPAGLGGHLSSAPPAGFSGWPASPAGPAALPLPVSSPYQTLPLAGGAYQSLPVGGRTPPMPGPPRYPSAPAAFGSGRYGADGMPIDPAGCAGPAGSSLALAINGPFIREAL